MSNEHSNETSVNERLHSALERLLECPDLNLDELEAETREAIQQAFDTLEAAKLGD